MIRVYISPDYQNVPANVDNGGIRRVAEAQIRHLPAFGIEVVHNVEDADILCNHGSVMTKYKGKPIVNVNHGFMWSRYPWGENYQQVNELVAASMKMAVAHTVPSEWVSRAVRRGGFFYPEVVYHGVDPDDFPVSEVNKGYVLWNKARADYVSDPNPILPPEHLGRVLPKFRCQRFPAWC